MLYLVATPIGNLKDITLRAIETLKEADEIYCEDTRHSLKLLSAYDIKKPLFAYHKFNEKEESVKIAEKLRAGKNIAVISDAGMPAVSDPGGVLIRTLGEEGLPYTVVPGACAFITALVLAGYEGTGFTFLGFMPEKSGEREKFLSEYGDGKLPLVFYCAPHDIKKCVESAYSVFGDRKAAAVKEITKIHERVERFTLKEGYPYEPKGEYVLIIEGKAEEDFSHLSEKEHIEKYLAMGLDKKEALKRVAKERGVSKSSLYKYTLEDK